MVAQLALKLVSECVVVARLVVDLLEDEFPAVVGADEVGIAALPLSEKLQDGVDFSIDGHLGRHGSSPFCKFIWIDVGFPAKCICFRDDLTTAPTERVRAEINITPIDFLLYQGSMLISS